MSAVSMASGTTIRSDGVRPSDSVSNVGAAAVPGNQVPRLFKNILGMKFKDSELESVQSDGALLALLSVLHKLQRIGMDVVPRWPVDVTPLPAQAGCRKYHIGNSLPLNMLVENHSDIPSMVGPYINFTVPAVDMGEIPPMRTTVHAATARDKLQIEPGFNVFKTSMTDDTMRKMAVSINGRFKIGKGEDILQYSALILPAVDDFDRSLQWLRGWMFFFAAVEYERLCLENANVQPNPIGIHPNRVPLQINIHLLPWNQPDTPGATVAWYMQQLMLTNANGRSFCYVARGMRWSQVRVLESMFSTAPYARFNYTQDVLAQACANHYLWAGECEIAGGDQTFDLFIFNDNLWQESQNWIGAQVPNIGNNFRIDNQPPYIGLPYPTAPEIKSDLMELARVSCDQGQCLIGLYGAMMLSCGVAIYDVVREGGYESAFNGFYTNGVTFWPANGERPHLATVFSSNTITGLGESVQMQDWIVLKSLSAQSLLNVTVAFNTMCGWARQEGFVKCNLTWNCIGQVSNIVGVMNVDPRVIPSLNDMLLEKQSYSEQETETTPVFLAGKIFKKSFGWAWPQELEIYPLTIMGYSYAATTVTTLVGLNYLTDVMSDIYKPDMALPFQEALPIDSPFVLSSDCVDTSQVNWKSAHSPICGTIAEFGVIQPHDQFRRMSEKLGIFYMLVGGTFALAADTVRIYEIEIDVPSSRGRHEEMNAAGLPDWQVVRYTDARGTITMFAAYNFFWSFNPASCAMRFYEFQFGPNSPNPAWPLTVARAHFLTTSAAWMRRFDNLDIQGSQQRGRALGMSELPVGLRRRRTAKEARMVVDTSVAVDLQTAVIEKMSAKIEKLESILTENEMLRNRAGEALASMAQNPPAPALMTLDEVRITESKELEGETGKKIANATVSGAGMVASKAGAARSIVSEAVSKLPLVPGN